VRILSRRQNSDGSTTFGFEHKYIGLVAPGEDGLWSWTLFDGETNNAIDGEVGFQTRRGAAHAMTFRLREREA
jgi:hypothetical protein